MELQIKNVIEETCAKLNRPDLFRKPLVGFSSASDEKFGQLKKLIGPWHLTPKEILPGAESVVSYFVPFTREVTLAPKSSEHGSSLWAEAYQEINNHFITINSAVSGILREKGYLAESIRPTHTYDPADLKCFWSHRSVAVIAGLGAFGANRLVITDKGSGGRFCSVITSAPLRSLAAAAEERCLYHKTGACRLCFDACPVKALSPDFFDKFLCQDKLNANENLILKQTALHSADTCGRCISACPFAYIE